MTDYMLPIITGTALSTGDLLRWNGSAWVNYADSAYAGSGSSVEDAGTTRPSGEDGYVAVAEIDGDGRLYFVVEGKRYYVSGTLDNTGMAMGLLLSLTYSS